MHAHELMYAHRCPNCVTFRFISPAVCETNSFGSRVSCGKLLIKLLQDIDKIIHPYENLLI